MPPRKKKIVEDTTLIQAGLIISTDVVPLSGLTTYYKNPRVGNVDLIAESLSKTGQYKPLIVNKGTLTGRTDEILAGNHTYLGMKKLHWGSGVRSLIDVDEETARRIVMVDNKSADAGTYDESLLAELFKEMDSFEGTGYNEEEVQDILESLDSAMSDLTLNNPPLDDIEYGEGDNQKKPRFQDVPLGDEEEADPETSTARERAKAAEEGKDIEKASDDLVGAFQLSNAMFFRKGSMTQFNIPAYKENMLVRREDLPDNLQSWAGSATKGMQAEDDTLWWLYAWAIDSTSGMSDTSRVIPCFFTWDEYFEQWWDSPAKYTSKVLNSGITMMCTPDFSADSEHGKTFNLWQTFRNHWLGRYFQEAGLKIIPNICWPDGDVDYLENIVLASLPEKVPVCIMQLQTLDEKAVAGGMDHFVKQVQMVVDRVHADVFILYSGNPGKKFFDEKIKMGDTELRWLLNRQAKLSESAKAKGRVKKVGI